MAKEIVSTLLFRIVMPILMSLCVIFRPCLLSAIYLLMMCCLPFVATPTHTTMAGKTGIFLKILIFISVLTNAAQITFQSAMALMPPYGHILDEDEFLEMVLRQVGLVTFSGLSPLAIVNWLLPDLIMLLISVIFFIIFKKVCLEEISGTDLTAAASKHLKLAKNYSNHLNAIGRFSVLALLCAVGVLRPSAQGGLYYVIFLSSATWWACCKELRKGFAITLCCVLPLVFIHLSCLYAYQLEIGQSVLSDNNTYARIFGMTQLTVYNTSEAADRTNVTVPDARNWEWNINQEWVSFLNPIMLYVLFYASVLTLKELFKPELKKKQGPFARLDGSFSTPLGRQMSQRLSKQKLIRTTTPKKRWQSATRKVRLIRGVSPSKKSTGRKSGLYQDSTGSVTFTGTTEDIPMDDLNSDDEEYEATLLENVLLALDTILQLIVRSSYIATNIIMMAWSITYLSWLTFALLIWANLVWLVPKQRRTMLRSSPFLVLYAWFLLLSAYVYSMNLTEDELPSSVKGVNFAEIGFVKVLNFPCVPLLVKTLYTVMFWITLRQFMQERLEARQTSALADMVAPLQVTVRTATGVDKEQEKTGSKLMVMIGNLLHRLMTWMWIWIVAATLFGVAITGERMTGFRILYMALFLIFVITFQFSFTVWRKIMFGFWLTVIIYSMIILVLVYTYQFQNFPSYWTEYLHISRKIQLDIGLEQFETKQLFVRLVTPTFFVIITVIQLHYFHRDFMKLSDPKNTTPDRVGNVEELEQSSMQGGADIDKSVKDDEDSTLQFDVYDIETLTSEKLKAFFRHFLSTLYKMTNLMFRFLEIHMIKFVLLIAMLVCIYDKCTLYFLIVVLLALACTFGRPMQIIAVYTSSLLMSLLLLTRMIYQVQYITPEKWNVTCKFGDNETVKNDAPWLGLRKEKEAGESLPVLVEWNIIYVVTVTLWKVVLVRQYNYKISRNRPTTRLFFMFPNISRVHADKSLKDCIKYLFNYGYYKFGLEISLIMVVALIGIRLDLYAIIHGLILCAFIAMGRECISKCWVFYLIFIAVSLPFQYFMSIGLPPSLCQQYPWDNSTETWQNLQDWAFLMSNYHPPVVKKLLCDFILLMMVSRQWVAFRIEKRYTTTRYMGGSNASVIHFIEDPNFKIPVPDFITYVRSYVDIVKKCVLQSFLWITLALVFLAGTNRINMYSLGYLMFAFLFLWHGSDIYLKPIPKILRQWQWLINYNVMVILIKTCLQLWGCVFTDFVPQDFCWILQVLGVGCLKKFESEFHSMSQSSAQQNENCFIPTEGVGISWDGICFGFLIFQRRIFNSYNFFHIVNDTKATTILASRGAELIEEMRQKTMKEQEEQERRILEKIKLKMDRIKANQLKIQDSIYKVRPKYRVKAPVTYKEAIRSGDYYMFDEIEDEDIDLLPSTGKDETDEEEGGRPDIGTLLSTAMKTDIGTAIRKHSQSQIGLARQHSMPVARRKAPRSHISSAFSAPPTIDEHKVTGVRIKEDTEPQPGTSKDDDDDDTDLDLPEQESWTKKLLRFILFIWAFVESALISLTKFLNRYSKNYRYVLRILATEKRILKEKTNYKVGVRLGNHDMWQPAGSYHSLLRQSMSKKTTSPLPSSEYGEEMSQYEQPTIFRLALAIWYTIMSRSEILCYFVVFLNQIKTATVLSLPLPLMVFCWGAMTIPRPTKTFWITIIAYTEVIVMLKCLFQFDAMPGNKGRTKTEYSFSLQDSHEMHPAMLFGLYRQDSYATWDLLLLLVVFFHRVLLKSLGLWSKSFPAAAAMLDDGEYVLQGGELVPADSVSIKSTSTAGSGSSKGKSPKKAAKKQADDQTSIKSSDHDHSSYIIQTQRVIPVDRIMAAVKMSLTKYSLTFREFIQQLLDPTSRIAVDVYFMMFFCDFFNFFVLLFGYSSFGSQQDGGVRSYLENNRVPPLFLFMLILQFMIIIIDRGIYLRKNIFVKIVFQYVQIILLHLWLFTLFPLITGSVCNTVLPPQIYYMVKCFYLLLSAFQIRCGYPTRILGNFLTKGYGFVNMILFRGFMLVPFLFELRTCMDWMWTETSMTIFDWIKMEDIFQHIFLIKCSRHLEEEYPQPRGEKKKPWLKYIIGSVCLILIIGFIWFPLVFFSLGNTVGRPNTPYEVNIEIRISTYEPVYRMTAQSNSIYSFTEDQFGHLQARYNGHKLSETFLYMYEPADVAAVKLSTDSSNIWSISPPDRERMVEEIKSPNPLTVTLDYTVSHKTSNTEDSGVLPGHVTIVIPPASNDTNGDEADVRSGLLKMLRNETTNPVLLEYIFPKFLKVTNRGTAEPVEDLMLEIPEIRAKEFRNVTVKLHSTTDKEWWTVVESCSDRNYNDLLHGLPYEDCPESLVIYTFNDKIFPPSLSLITGGGIIGLYTTIVFVASRVLRGLFADQSSKIMFEEMPFVDRVLQLCLDVYLVREACEFCLEEDLFAKLVFLFRSPETLIKWTRPREELAENEDDDNPEGEGD